LTPLGKDHRGEKAFPVGGMVMKCPSCGTNNPDVYTWCSLCGKPLQEAQQVESGGRRIGVRGTQRFQPDVPKKKTPTLALGVILAIFGLIGVIIAMTVYPIWQENKDILQTKEAFGADTPEDHSLVNTQTMVVLGGFIVGGPMVLLGVILIVSAMAYNSKIDKAVLERAFAPSVQHYGPTRQMLFCQYCGKPLTPGAIYCAICGRQIQK
jgi:uncharacterized membrane protein YvbJ